MGLSYFLPEAYFSINGWFSYIAKEVFPRVTTARSYIVENERPYYQNYLIEFLANWIIDKLNAVADKQNKEG